VVVHAMHPGWADTPGVASSLPGFHAVTRRLLRTPEQGADTITWLAHHRKRQDQRCVWLDREPHVTNVLPGTDPTPEERQQLWEALATLTARSRARTGAR